MSRNVLDFLIYNKKISGYTDEWLECLFLILSISFLRKSTISFSAGDHCQINGKLIVKSMKILSICFFKILLLLKGQEWREKYPISHLFWYQLSARGFPFTFCCVCRTVGGANLPKGTHKKTDRDFTHPLLYLNV